MQPTVLATWQFGAIAARAALPLLAQGRSALDAALAGAQAVEDDPAVNSVGYGGLADSAGNVSLDACVMEGRTLSCGAVGGLQNIRHAAALARCVMEKTPHLFLVGAGATQFALQQGFPLESLHTSESLALWEKRGLVKAAQHLSHDTVTVLALDAAGSLAGVCSTSGLSHKLPGRVGDSPIIGAGLYVDDSAGAAGATGVGEEIMRIGASLLIVEALRAGRTPQEACELAARRVSDVAARRSVKPAHAAFLALDPSGRIGAACTKETNFHYAIGRGTTIDMIQAVEI
jgi:isoaspartyl peptidase/L-asparaginase-like protein (Ntn-hydrolase superfamily)